MTHPKFEDTLPIEETSSIPRFEDTHPIEATSEISQLESGLRGAAQGASFSTADELTGAGQTALEAAKGNVPLTMDDIVEMYKKKRDESRTAYKAAEEANPATYIGGEIAGGATTSALIPGLGAGKLLQAGSRGLGALALQGAKTGATAGALVGLGQSEGTTPQEQLQDVAMGAGSGAIGGAVIPAGIAGVKAGASGLKNLAKSTVERARDVSPALDNFLNVVKRSSEGQKVVGQKAFAGQVGELNALTDDIKSSLDDAFKSAGNKFEEAYASGNKQVDITDAINLQIRKVDDKIAETSSQDAIDEMMKLKKNLENLKNNTQQEGLASIASPKQMNTQASETYQNFLSKPDITQTAKTMAGDIRTQQKDLAKNMLGNPEAQAKFEQGNKEYRNLSQAMGLVDDDLRSNDVVDLTKAKEKLSGLVQNLSEDTKSGVKNQERFNQFTKKFAEVAPESAQDVADKSRDLAERMSLNRKASGTGLSGLSSFAGQTLIGAQSIGSAYKMGADGLNQMATKAMSIPGGQGVSKVLQSMIDENPQRRAALMYGLIQQPAYRHIMEQLMPSQETEE